MKVTSFISKYVYTNNATFYWNMSHYAEPIMSKFLLFVWHICRLRIRKYLGYFWDLANTSLLHLIPLHLLHPQPVQFVIYSVLKILKHNLSTNLHNCVLNTNKRSSLDRKGLKRVPSITKKQMHWDKLSHHFSFTLRLGPSGALQDCHGIMTMQKYVSSISFS